MLARVGPVDVVRTGTPEELDAALDACGDRRLVVAGGDGSLHLTVARLDARGELADRPLGLVPLGTGNDLARCLGVPLDPEDAARLVADGEPRPLDLLRSDDGSVVVNAVHVGVGAVAAEKASGLKARLGALAYPVGAVAAGLRSTGWRLRVEVDGTQVLADGRDTVLMVGVGNGTGIGGGTPLLPDASVDDGLLDVVVSAATGPLARIRFGAALRKGEHGDGPQARRGRGRRVVVSGEPVGANADGELLEPAPRWAWSVEPAAWSLVRP